MTEQTSHHHAGDAYPCQCPMRPVLGYQPNGSPTHCGWVHRTSMRDPIERCHTAPAWLFSVMGKTVEYVCDAHRTRLHTGLETHFWVNHIPLSAKEA